MQSMRCCIGKRLTLAFSSQIQNNREKRKEKNWAYMFSVLFILDFHVSTYLHTNTEKSNPCIWWCFAYSALQFQEMHLKRVCLSLSLRNLFENSKEIILVSLLQIPLLGAWLRQQPVGIICKELISSRKVFFSIEHSVACSSFLNQHR